MEYGKGVAGYVIGFLVIFSCISFAHAGDIESPFNDLSLDLDDDVEEFSLLLGGHLYGAHGNSVFPSPSLLASIDMINSSGAKFFVSLGDNFRRADDVHVTNFQHAFASRLNMPLFNTVGNHDLSDRQQYETRFGKTYYRFVYGSGLFVLLDSELNAGSIVGDQLGFLRAAMDEARNPEIKHVFFLSHKLVWDVGNPDYQVVFKHANQSYPDNNFKNEIAPALAELSKHKMVYWISGDIGTSRSLPLFYQKEPDHGITYVAVGLGDTMRDAILQVHINSSNGVSFRPISLTGRELSRMEDYGLDYWHDHFGAETVVDVYWGKLLRMLRARYFWTGILASLPVIVLAIFLARKQRRS